MAEQERKIVGRSALAGLGAAWLGGWLQRPDQRLGWVDALVLVGLGAGWFVQRRRGK